MAADRLLVHTHGMIERGRGMIEALPEERVKLLKDVAGLVGQWIEDRPIHWGKQLNWSLDVFFKHPKSTRQQNDLGRMANGLFKEVKTLLLKTLDDLPKVVEDRHLIEDQPRKFKFVWITASHDLMAAGRWMYNPTQWQFELAQCRPPEELWPQDVAPANWDDLKPPTFSEFLDWYEGDEDFRRSLRAVFAYKQMRFYLQDYHRHRPLYDRPCSEQLPVLQEAVNKLALLDPGEMYHVGRYAGLDDPAFAWPTGTVFGDTLSQRAVKRLMLLKEYLHRFSCLESEVFNLSEESDWVIWWTRNPHLAGQAYYKIYPDPILPEVDYLGFNERIEELEERLLSGPEAIERGRYMVLGQLYTLGRKAPKMGWCHHKGTLKRYLIRGLFLDRPDLAERVPEALEQVRRDMAPQPKKQTLTKKEINQGVLAYMTDHPDAKRKDIADAVGCSTGAVSDTPAWKVAKIARESKRKKAAPKGKKIGLDIAAEQAVANDPDILEQLVAEEERAGADTPSDMAGEQRQKAIEVLTAEQAQDRKEDDRSPRRKRRSR